MKETQDHTQRAHSRIGASSSQRWINCPGSLQLCEGLPNLSLEVAEEGTAAHMLAEKVLKETPNAFYYVGREKFNGYEVTKEMAEHVQVYVDYVRNVAREYKGALTIEERFDLSWIEPNMFGTLDACVREHFGTLEIIDFKYGAGKPVEVEDNTQLIYYALGAAKDGDFEKVRLTVVQPRCPHKDGPIRSFDMSMDELMAYVAIFKNAVIKTREIDAPLSAGDWCGFCPAKGKCPQLKAVAEQTALMEFDVVGDEPKLPALSTLTDAQIAKIIKYKTAIESFLDAVKSDAYSRLMKGEHVEGLKLVSGRGRRGWKDEQMAEAILFENLKDDAWERKLLTPAKAEKLLPKTLISDLSHTIPGALQVAHETDKRKAALVDPRSEFGVLEESNYNENDF